MGRRRTRGAGDDGGTARVGGWLSLGGGLCCGGGVCGGVGLFGGVGLGHFLLSVDLGIDSVNGLVRWFSGCL